MYKADPQNSNESRFKTPESTFESKFRETSILEYSSLKRILREVFIYWKNTGDLTIRTYSSSHELTVFTCSTIYAKFELKFLGDEKGPRKGFLS